jgi:alpha-mannosidase
MRRFAPLGACAILLAAIVIVAGAALPAARPAAALPSSDPSRATIPALDEIIIVFKTHFDIGYTDMAKAVVDRYRTTMIDQALDIVDLNRALPPERRFVWTLPGWPMTKIAEDWPGQTPERKARVEAAFKDGRFVVHALPFTLHTELLEPEDLVRGLGFSSRLSRAAGFPLPRDAKMTDVPSHSWILPTLLTSAGVEFLHLGCNAASRSPLVPPLFWWEGPDGSRLLTMYSAAGYGTGLVPPADWPYRTWLALIHTGDNEGPPKPEDVDKIFAEAAAKLPGVKVRIGRLSDFSDAIKAEKAEIPVVRGDMPDTWIHGPMSDPMGSILARNLRPSLGTAEALATHLATWGVAVQPGSAAALGAAYEQSLLFGEHTWGGALYWVTEYGAKTKWGYGDVWKKERAEGRFKRLEESWAEHRAYIEKARDLAAPVLAGEMKALAGATGPDGPRVVAFNPLPWKRSALVPVKFPGDSPRSVYPAEGGPSIPVISDASGSRFLAADVPPFGYRTYITSRKPTYWTGPALDKVAANMESRWFRVEFDRVRGTVASIFDKRNGRELIDTSAQAAFGQYLYERFDTDRVAAFRRAYVKIAADWGVAELGKPNLPPASQAPYRAITPAKTELSFDRTQLTTTAIMTSPPSRDIPYAVTTRLTLYPDAPYFDLEMTLLKKPADPWPEAGWIALPFKIESPRLRLGRLGSIVDSEADIVAGSNRYLFAVNTGVALYDPNGNGVGVCSPDSPLISLDEPGLWKYSPNYVPRKPRVFVQLFNNQWTTNFRFWNEGTITARVRVWAFARYEGVESLVRPSLETRYPMRAEAADGPKGPLPAVQSGLEILPAGTLVTAFGPNPDGEGTILRLWELAGRSGRCTVRLPAGMKAGEIQPVDLRGRPVGRSFAIEGGTFAFEQKAFAPITFLIGGTPASATAGEKR